MIDFVEACHETIDFETKSMHFRRVFRHPQRTQYCTDCQNIHTRPYSYMAADTKKNRVASPRDFFNAVFVFPHRCGRKRPKFFFFNRTPALHTISPSKEEEAGGGLVPFIFWHWWRQGRLTKWKLLGWKMWKLQSVGTTLFLCKPLHKSAPK